MSTAEEDRQLRRVIQRTLKDQKEERSNRLRVARLRTARIREVEEDGSAGRDRGNPAKALYVDFDCELTLGARWAGKTVRHRLKSVEYAVVGEDGISKPPDGMQSFSADDMGKVGLRDRIITLNERRKDEIVNEGET